MKKTLFLISSSEEVYAQLFHVHFRTQLEKFVIPKLENDLRKYVGKNQLDFETSMSTLVIDDETLVSKFTYVDIGVWRVCCLFNRLQLFWRDKAGQQIVYPDQPFEGEIEFWLENYPTPEGIIRCIENMKDLWEPRKVIKIVRESFAFKVRETRFFQDNYPSVNFTIKSKADVEAVKELLYETFEAYNEANEAHEDEGVMHSIYLHSAIKGKMLFYIDAGSAPPEAVIVLLKALEKAKFDIESVTIG